ncbi:hypothetical protein C8J57DRAFT_1644605 [Mycena rebaudengoi]|nr:hypothetical protein C8J57DRAFT_1644605 [Mycena rebaudengoi]
MQLNHTVLRQSPPLVTINKRQVLPLFFFLSPQHLSVTMALVLSAKTLGKKGKEELQAIAAAMELDTTGIKDVLLTRIKANIAAKPTLAEDPQFLPLFTYKKSKAASKTSADQTTEEALQIKALATGANKFLLNNKVKTDPPGQFKALLIGGSAGAKQGTPSGEESTDTKKEEIEGGKPSGGELDEAQGKDSTTNKDKPVDGDEFESEFSDDCTSSASVNSNNDLDTRLDDLEIEDISHKKTEITFVSTETPDTMLVKFFSAQNPAAEPREVYLPTSSISVAATASADGIVKFSARISEIVPVAVKFDSPIKAHGGAIFRPPIRAGGSQLRLGKIQDICAGKSNALQVSLVDKYELNTASDGLLSCDFFLDRELTTAEGSPDASKDNSTTTGDTFTAPAASDSAAIPAAVDDSAVPAPHYVP